jgi:IS30 family transposase
MKQITREQRYQIEAYLKAGKSKDFIASQLAINRSNIFREVKRNSKKRGIYNASYAQMLCDERKERFKRIRSFDQSKESLIKEYIEQEQWSPEQIVGYCKKKGISMVSHERIYQYIRQEKEQGGGLYKHLRHRLKHRKRPVGGKHISIKNRVSIDDRPQVINNKQRFGDWEIDTIIGKDGKGAIVTIVERTTAFLMMRKLPKGKNAESLADNVIDMLMPYKNQIYSITSDNGTEFAEHTKISKGLEAGFFFAHPYSSWERGLNEYTNKLIRQYILKKSEFENYDDKYIAEIQYKINRRPRKNMEFNSPKELFYNLVA